MVDENRERDSQRELSESEKVSLGLNIMDILTIEIGDGTPLVPQSAEDSAKIVTEAATALGKDHHLYKMIESQHRAILVLSVLKFVEQFLKENTDLSFDYAGETLLPRLEEVLEPNDNSEKIVLPCENIAINRGYDKLRLLRQKLGQQ